MADTEREPVLRRIARALRLAPPPVAEAPRALDPDAFFRSVHGTEFDSASRVDREKMNALLRARNAAAF